MMNRRGSILLDLKDIDGDGKLDLLLGETWNDGPDGYDGFNWPDVDRAVDLGLAGRRSGSASSSRPASAGPRLRGPRASSPTAAASPTSMATATPTR